MADNMPPFVSNPATTGAEPAGALGPFRDTVQGAAEAGLGPSESELPIRATSSGGFAATTSGYSADGSQAPLPPPGSDQGSGLPPSGFRR